MKRFIIACVLVMSLSVTAFADVPNPKRFQTPRKLSGGPADLRPTRPSRQVITRAKISLLPVKDQECAVEFVMNVSKDVDYEITFRDIDNKKVVESLKGKSSDENSEIKRVFKYQRPEKGQELHYLLRAKCKAEGRRERIYVRRITVYNVNDVIHFIAH